MNAAPAVIVKKGGALSALFHGIALVLTTGIVACGALGLYSLRVFDRQFAALGDVGEKIIQTLPQWQQALPPVLADALNDRRAPEYASQLAIHARIVPGERHDRSRVLIEVTNRGGEAVSLLALNLVFEDGEGIPVRDQRSFAVTPLPLSEPGVRGPLYPGMQRRYVEWVDLPDDAQAVVTELVELRVFNPAPPAEDSPAAGG